MSRSISRWVKPVSSINTVCGQAAWSQITTATLGPKVQSTNRTIVTGLDRPWKIDWVAKTSVSAGQPDKRQTAQVLRCSDVAARTSARLVVFPGPTAAGLPRVRRGYTQCAHPRACTRARGDGIAFVIMFVCTSCYLQSLKVANAPCRRFFPSRSTTAAPSPRRGKTDTVLTRTLPAYVAPKQ